MTRTRNNVGLLLLASGLTLSSMALVGCDGRDDASAAIESAGRTLSALVSDGPGLADASRRSVYNDVISTLQPAVSGGSDQQAEAASQMLAEAHGGLGQLAAEAAADMQAENDQTIRSLRTAQDQWESFNGLAAALVSQDAADEFAELDRQIEARAQEIVDARREQSNVENQINNLRARIGQAEDNARAARQREMMLRQDAVNQSQTQRAATYERLREESRRGDAFDQDAAMLTAEMERLAPTLADVTGLRERLESQAELLATAREDLTRMIDGRRAQANELRGKAQEAAANVNAFAQQVQARYGELPAGWDAAIQHYDKAISSARRAGDRLKQAGFERARASALLSKAQASTDVASVMSLLANSPTKLPNDFQGAASAARDAAEAAASEARNAYSDVISAFDSAASGPMADRMDSITNRLMALGDPDRNAERNAGSQDQGFEDDTGDAGMDDASDDGAMAGGAEAEVWALMDEMIGYLNAGDIRAARNMLSGPERELALLDQMLPLLEGSAQLDKAFQDAYGMSLADASAGNPQMAGMTEGMNTTVNRDDLELIMSSDTTAEVRNRDADAQGVMSDAMLFSHDGNGWIITTEPMDDAEYQQVQMMLPMFGSLGDVFTSVAEEVRSGAFDTAEQAMQVFGMRMMQAMGMGGGGAG